MTKRIQSDRKDFKDVYSGKTRKELKSLINNGKIFGMRGDKKLVISVPNIDQPILVHGSGNSGVGRGPGKKGDVIGKDEQGQGKGHKAGEGEGEGILISVDLDDILHLLGEDLELPPLQPKPQEVFEDIDIKYNNISLTGPRSLIHPKRTMLQAYKRTIASQEFDILHKVPGMKEKVRLVSPINSDFRYRQYKEIKLPSSNAVIFFARDGSGSVDEYRCDIISDMCWWIDLWIRQFYDRVERCYVWHDVVAKEVDEHTFYRYRSGGGTLCSSAFKFISNQFEARFPLNKWNVYVFYFTDGENMESDNPVLVETIKESLAPRLVNFVGISQILSYSNDGVKEYIDNHLKMPNLKTTAITGTNTGWFNTPSLSDDERGNQIKKAIRELLGKQPK